MDELALLLQVHPMEFVAVTETWLNDEVVDQLIQVNKYNIFRNDRSHGRGGGVCAFVSTDIPSTVPEEKTSKILHLNAYGYGCGPTDFLGS